MTRLERDLRALGPELDWPATPDLAAAVAAQLDDRAPARRGRPRWRLALIVALLVLVPAGVVMAVPDTREAVLDWLGVRSVEVRRAAALPALGPAVGLEPNSGLDEARSLAPYPVLVPDALGAPDAVNVSRGRGGIVVSLLYGPRPGLPAAPGTGVGLLVSFLDGGTNEVLVSKLVAGATRVRRLRVAGAPALSLEGAPHLVLFLDSEGVREERLRLSANALLLERGGALVRLEAALPARDLLAIAESLR